MQIAPPVLGFIGGCHVSGHLVAEHESFVNRLQVEMGACEVISTPHVTISQLQRHILPALRTRSAYMFIQLGNFEFSASWLQIFKCTVGLPPGVARHLVRPFQPAPEPGTDWNNPGLEPTAPTNSSTTRRTADVVKVALGSLLYVLTWVLLRRYRQQFRLINRVVRQNPHTTFVCLSPFPSAANPHNLLRRLGGQILQHRLTAYPNLRWVDTHQVLSRQDDFLTDGIHLNATGHRVLAEHLRIMCLCDATP